jgi:GT2 family glycosyltransferase
MKYRRESDQTGLRRDLLVCAFWQQISHVGFLILTEAAKRVGFRDRSEVGLAVDTDFGIRLAQAYRGYAHVFVDRFTIQSRIGPSSLGRTSRDAAWKLYDSIRRIDNVSQEEALALDCLLRRLQPLALREYSLAHGRLAALRLFLSRPISLEWRFSEMGLYLKLGHEPQPGPVDPTPLWTTLGSSKRGVCRGLARTPAERESGNRRLTDDT